jgi:hypothetical protein
MPEDFTYPGMKPQTAGDGHFDVGIPSSRLAHVEKPSAPVLQGGQRIVFTKLERTVDECWADPPSSDHRDPGYDDTLVNMYHHRIKTSGRCSGRGVRVPSRAIRGSAPDLEVAARGDDPLGFAAGTDRAPR